MIATWGTLEKGNYYYELAINEIMEKACENAFEQAYQAQCQRERALWARRNSDSGTPS
jgi:hypothetical protein